MNVRIYGTGKYLPKQMITDHMLDKKMDLAPGTTFKKSGVQTRYFVQAETASMMGALAAKEALHHAGLRLSDIDCIVCCSATQEQAMPATATLIAAQLGEEARGIPAFDLNSTCLSFLTALDLLSYPIMQGRYRYVLLISTEIASVGLDWKDKETATLFGDAAAAIVLGKGNPKDTSRIIASKMETYSEGAHLSGIPGGGTRLHPRYHLDQDGHPHLFQMDGPGIFKLSLKVLPLLYQQVLTSAKLSTEDIQLVIPHQASAQALKLIRKKLVIPTDKFLITIKDYGNTIAASIPLALHLAITTKKVSRNDTIVLLGSAAGLSIGVLIFVY